MHQNLNHFLRAAVLTLNFFIAGSFGANAATIVHSYDDKGQVTGVVGIAGISEESSLYCQREAPASELCKCNWGMFTGSIDSVDYRSGTAIAQGIVVNTGKDAAYVFFGKDWDRGLSLTEAEWLPKMLRRGEQVIVFAERCGAGGRNIVARDVYAQRLLREVLSLPTEPKGSGAQKVAPPSGKAEAQVSVQNAEIGSVDRPTSGKSSTWSDHSRWVKELGRDEQIAVIVELLVQVTQPMRQEVSSDAKVKAEVRLVRLKQIGMTNYMLAQLATHAPDLRDALQASADATLVAIRGGEREKALEGMRRADELLTAIVATTDKKAAAATIDRHRDAFRETAASLVLRLRRLNPQGTA